MEGEEMNYYNIASDFKAQTIDEYVRLNKDNNKNMLFETYGQYTLNNILGSGRDYESLPKIDLYDLKHYIEYSNARGIEFNYAINSPCMGNYEFTQEGNSYIRENLMKLYDVGVRSVTVALPSLIQIIQSLDIDLEIKVSVISQVNTSNKAMQYKKMGIHRIVTDETINRNFEQLKRITAAFGDGIEVIANSLCHQDCIYRTYHYNQTGHDSVYKEKTSVRTFYNHKCMMKRAENVEEWLKLCWIRPEDIPLYNQSGIYRFKLQGRHTVLNGNPVKTVEAYFNQSYSGDLIDLLEMFNCPYTFKPIIDNKKLNGYIKPFFENTDFCKRNCDLCGYCKTVAKKCTDYGAAEALNEAADIFYREYDDFS